MSIFDNIKSEGPRPVSLRALVVFTATGMPQVVCAHGWSIELEMEELGTCAEEVGLWTASDEEPDSGVWVWEGYVWHSRDCWSGEHEHEYRTTSWREPTDEEWECFRHGDRPWPSQYIICPQCGSPDTRYAGKEDRAMCLGCKNSFDPYEDEVRGTVLSD